MQRGVDRICVRTTEDVFVAEHIRGFARKRPVIDPQHEKQIEDLTSRARHNRQVTLFLQLGSSAFSYLDGREEKRVNYPSHIRRINDVIATFGYDQVARALADTRENGACGADHIHNLHGLRLRKKQQEAGGPLHLTRKADLLHIEFPPAKLKLYDQDTQL
ncbi:MAG TPA: hypothetical protein DCR55_09655 [Lentisphaeria bacterium]|nr:hypothetical protein [Lentisphaeria bacterium]